MSNSTRDLGLSAVGSRLGRLKVALAVAVALICVGLASCGGGSGGSSQPGASPSTSHKSGWG